MTMNEASRIRLELARRNAEQLARNPNVRAILLVGSLAQGRADEFSDIDCSVYYHAPPSEAEFQALCARARASGGNLYGGTAAEGFALYEYVEGIRCDFGHVTVDAIEKELQSMLDAPDLDDANKQIVLSGFATGMPLYGEGWISAWQHKLTAYPSKVAPALVQKHLRFYPRWVLEKMGLARNDMLFLRSTLLELEANILGILYGLNGIYPPGKLKGVDHSIAQMHIKPDNLLARLEGVLQVEPAEAIHQLYMLIEETISLTERTMPDIDTGRIRRVLALTA